MARSIYRIAVKCGGAMTFLFLYLTKHVMKILICVHFLAFVLLNCNKNCNTIEIFKY